MARAYTEEEFKAKCAALYGDKLTVVSLEKIGFTRNILMQCSVHGEVVRHKSEIAMGKGCPKCGNAKGGGTNKYSLKEYEEKARRTNGADYTYLSLEGTTNVKIGCPIHGEVIVNRAKHLLGAGCKKCNRATANDYRRYTIESYTTEASLVHSGKYTYNSLAGLFVIYTCKDHGEVKQNMHNHLRGVQCPKCSSSKGRKTFSEIVARAKEVHGDKYFYKELDRGLLMYVCPKHGEVIQKYADHNKGRGCIKCAREEFGIEQRRTLLEYAEEAKKSERLRNSNLSYLEVDGKNVMYNCASHGTQIQNKFFHLTSSGCPRCVNGASKKVSGFSDKVANWLTSKGISYTEETNLPYAGTKQTADFLLGDLVLELNGNFWHTEDKVGQTKHKDKVELAKSNGYEVLMISDTDWEDNQEAVAQNILYRLGALRTLNAESLTAKQVPQTLAAAFVAKNSVVKGTKANYWYGLYEESVLVSVAGFAKVTRKAHKASRAACKLVCQCASVNVRGSLERLIGCARAELGFTTLWHTVDDRYFSDRPLEACGFVSVMKLPIKYYYTKSGKVVLKSQLQKSYMANNPKMLYYPTLTEKQLAELNGFKRIYDAGKTLWTKTY